MDPLVITPGPNYPDTSSTRYDPMLGWQPGYCPWCGGAVYTYHEKMRNTPDVGREWRSHFCGAEWSFTNTEDGEGNRYMVLTTFAHPEYPTPREGAMTITETNPQETGEFTDAQRDTLRELGAYDTIDTFDLRCVILRQAAANQALIVERDGVGGTLEQLSMAQRDANQLRANISMIGDRLLSEAQDRGWCSDFDHIVKDLNESMHDVEGGQLKTRQFSRRVTVQFEIDVEGSGTPGGVNEALVAWMMHDQDNQGELQDRGDNHSVAIRNSVVRNCFVVANDAN